MEVLKHSVTKSWYSSKNLCKYLVTLTQNFIYEDLKQFKIFLARFFETFCTEIYIKNILKQFSTQMLDIVHNFSCPIFSDILSQNIY